ncbi:MAG TPA: EF-P beta-lysylation protein EpmB [Steroidobacteraceae bacterium]|nr:EF-P beta-lysylation protein EpmB [Steroidobacteraceae bacterium]
MIAATSLSSQFIASSAEASIEPVAWRKALADAVSSVDELCRMLDLDPEKMSAGVNALREFPLKVPRGFVARMRRGDANDPLLLQVFPFAAEEKTVAGFGVDPVGDLLSRAATGLLHKYEGRALLIATGACAVHCRYCFRRHFPYSDESALQNGWGAALEQLRADASINEVILSGGDPLSLSDRRLIQLTDQLAAVPNVKRLRIHTRYPIVLPERIDAGLLAWLDGVSLQKVLVIHANHAHEIDGSVGSACSRLRERGVTLLNQSVLLAGVNDDASTLANLSEALFAVGVLPYYLHVLDKVAGAAHFAIPDAKALEIHRQLAARMPGYLVPKLVREIAGAPAKMPVTAVP